MKAADVVRELKFWLPVFTDKFTDSIGVASIVSSGLIATVTTTVAHNLVSNDYVHIWGCLIPNAITQLAQVDGVATSVTTVNHDLTEGYQESIEITGANESGYNGNHKLLSVPNRRTFTFEVDSSTPSPATGSPLLLEDLKLYTYNGYHEITVLNATQFTFQLEKELGSPAYGNITMKVRPRITAAASLDEALKAYTRQSVNNLLLYVVLDNMIASKDRSEGTDAVVMVGNVVELRQLVVQQFHVYVFFPNKGRITNRKNRDDADEILASLGKCIIGNVFLSSFVELPNSVTVFVRSDFVSFVSDSTSIVHVHDFIFEQTTYITQGDSLDNDKSVAMRDIYGKYKSSFIDDNEVKFEGNINLDDEPLT